MAQDAIHFIARRLPCKADTSSADDQNRKAVTAAVPNLGSTDSSGDHV